MTFPPPELLPQKHVPHSGDPSRKKTRSGSEVSPHNFIGYIECLFGSKFNKLARSAPFALEGEGLGMRVMVGVASVLNTYRMFF